MSATAPTLFNRLLGWLEPASRRWGILACCALCLVGLSLWKPSFKDRFTYVISDGQFYYLYLPSLLIDGSLDFKNQVRTHWMGDPPWQPGEPGPVRNKYPIGVALTWTPAFLLAHGLTTFTAFAADGYTPLYQIANLLCGVLLGLAALLLAERLVREAFGVGPGVAGLAVLTYYLGGNLIYYSFREPLMSHVAGSFWVNAALLLIWRIGWRIPETCRLGAWWLLVFCVSMAIICRPTNAIVLGPVGAGLLVRAAMMGHLARVLAWTPLLLTGLTPLFLQMAVWQALYGHYLPYTYEGEGFHWARPAGWHTLFSTNHGLFIWSPVLILSVLGLIWQWRYKPSSWLAALTVSCVAMWYCNSAWHCWNFGDAYGARAFIELNAVFIGGLAVAFQALQHAASRWQKLALAYVGVCVVYNFVLMFLFIRWWIPHDQGFL